MAQITKAEALRLMGEKAVELAALRAQYEQVLADNERLRAQQQEPVQEHKAGVMRLVDGRYTIEASDYPSKSLAYAAKRKADAALAARGINAKCWVCA